MSNNLTWVANRLGKFTIKSALTIIHNEQTVASDALWWWVWQPRVPQRIRYFTRFVINGKLLTNLVRFTRHMTTSPCYTIHLRLISIMSWANLQPRDQEEDAMTASPSPTSRAIDHSTQSLILRDPDSYRNHEVHRSCRILDLVTISLGISFLLICSILGIIEHQIKKIGIESALATC